MFITFEGLDGAGKSTQIERLRARLEGSGRRVVCTREPGGTPLGDSLRALLLDPARRDIAPRTEALLYAASRAQLLWERVGPALARGDVVLCDRYVDASLAYQGEGLGLGMDAVAAVNRFATGGLTPDLTFLLDVPVAVSRGRVRTGRGQADRIEQRGDEYFSRVRDAFLRIATAEPERVVVLDGTLDAQALEQEIWSRVEKRL
ncbi:dTMP kinase [Alicyclobacillus macrosporangiidus]|uniref:Thymidylate kinase n=1 Tax=Alicyclobacillus macrosporangiidus TaxID=392015 RepID=A0A1I7KRN4_9BACL|nr:dTMP kinase [Alicyclobacillus macrosporangiidus]SFV00075.1 dTMP kinase [Alicyclobacillus macrosporangiidus]